MNTDAEHRSFPWRDDSFDGDAALTDAVAWINVRRGELAAAGRVIVSREVREIRFARVVVATIDHAPAKLAERPAPAFEPATAGQLVLGDGSAPPPAGFQWGGSELWREGDSALRLRFE